MYVVAAAAALVLLPGNDDASWSTVLQTLTLTNIYFDDHLPDGLTQMWSLATEVAFYLVLPAADVAGPLPTPERRRERAAGSVLVLAAMLVINVLLGRRDDHLARHQPARWPAPGSPAT